MTRRYDPTRAKRHWVYSRSDIEALFGVSETTVTNWIKRGLNPVDDHRPQLFSGYELRRFLNDMSWPYGRAPKDGRLYCCQCPGFNALRQGNIRTSSMGIDCLSVAGLCSACHNPLQAVVPAADIAEIIGASLNIPRHSSAGKSEGVSEETERSGAKIPPETTSSNLRWLYAYRRFLEEHQNFKGSTVDGHLSAVSRMSAFLRHKRYEAVTIDDAVRFKAWLRRRVEAEDDEALSITTIGHVLDRCRAFFTWLERQPGPSAVIDLPGYFSLSRGERALEAGMSKGTSLSFDQALCLFLAMPDEGPVALRNRAIIAMFITTGIRIQALITLRGRHVNCRTRWINQDPREVETKNGKHIRTYCLDLDNGLLAAIETWSDWRTDHGFGANAPFFLPDRYLQANPIGFGHQPDAGETAEGWKSGDPVQKIIKEAASAAGLTDPIASHDFRRILQPFLAQRGQMMVVEEVALQLNFGHTPVETIRKHYAGMSDDNREIALDEVCRRAMTSRCRLDLYLAYERNQIAETHPDYRRARDIFEQNSLREEAG